MKTKLLTLIACLFLANGVQAQTVIHYWDFDRLAPYGGPANADSLRQISSDTSFALVGTMLYQALSTAPTGYSTYYDTVAGTTTNIQLALGAAPSGGKALNLHNPSAQMEARFYVPSGGYKDVVFGFGGKTNNGATRMNFSCSLDSGQNWTTSGVQVTSAFGIGGNDSLSSTYTLHTVTFDSAIANNNNRFVVRITFTNGSSASNIGSMVFDNVTLMGTRIPRAGINNIAESKKVDVYPDPATTSIYMQTSGIGNRSVKIYNATGKLVGSTTANTQLINMPVANLSAGMYYVMIHEDVTGVNYNGKFVKE